MYDLEVTITIPSKVVEYFTNVLTLHLGRKPSKKKVDEFLAEVVQRWGDNMIELAGREKG